jgi:putative transposase
MGIMVRNITLAPGEFYHIYNRGTEKRQIFHTKRDYDRFLALLYVANGSLAVDLKRQGSTLSEITALNKGENLVDICAYCLMPNHFHLIIRERAEGGISTFMQKLTTAYTMYFNKLNDRSGALFQGKFKAEHANEDRYLSYLIAYLHLNPIKLVDPKWKEKGIKDPKWAKTFLENYKYSSYLDYTKKNKRPESKIIDKTALPQYYESPVDFQKSVDEWLSWKDNEK